MKSGVRAMTAMSAMMTMLLVPMAVRARPLVAASAPADRQHARAGVPACPVAAVDTSSWETSSNDALAFSFRHPAAYREMKWADSSPGLPVTSDWWHREGVVWSLEFSRRRPVPDSAARATFGNRAGYHECVLRTIYGPLTVRLFRDGITGYGRDTVSLYNAVIDWPAGARRTSLHLETTSRDPRRLIEQLVIAETVRPR